MSNQIEELEREIKYLYDDLEDKNSVLFNENERLKLSLMCYRH